MKSHDFKNGMNPGIISSKEEMIASLLMLEERSLNYFILIFG